jgi:RNA polymerase sigma-70 factor (ECF subfamily)
MRCDAFIQLWRNRETISESRGGMKSWLCVAAKSRAIDCYPKKGAKKRGQPRRTALCMRRRPFDQTLDTVLQRELLAVINALGEPDREILLRRFYYRQTQGISPLRWI